VLSDGDRVELETRLAGAGLDVRSPAPASPG
jgi:hypothetical protein